MAWKKLEFKNLSSDRGVISWGEGDSYDQYYYTDLAQFRGINLAINLLSNPKFDKNIFGFISFTDWDNRELVNNYSEYLTCREDYFLK